MIINPVSGLAAGRASAGGGTVVFPVLTLATPSVDAAGTTVTLFVTSSLAGGTMYWIISESDVIPDGSSVMTNLDGIGVAAVDSGQFLLNTTGLQTIQAEVSASKTYYAYFFHVISGLTSGVTQSDAIDTTPIVPVLSLGNMQIFLVGEETRIYAASHCSVPDGTTYYYLSASETPPSVSDLKAGTGAIASYNSNEVLGKTFHVFTELTLLPETTYYCHLLRTNLALTDSAIYTISATTVAEEPDPAPVLTLPVLTSTVPGSIHYGYTCSGGAGGTHQAWFSKTNVSPIEGGYEWDEFLYLLSQPDGAVSYDLEGFDEGYVYYVWVNRVNTDGVSSEYLSLGSVVVAVTPDLPVLSLPTTSGLTTTGGTFSVTTSKSGGMLFYAVAGSAYTPSLAEVKSPSSQPLIVFSGQVIADAVGALGGSLAGLEPGQTYKIHFVQTDLASQDSNLLSSAEFQTLYNPVVETPVLSNLVVTANSSSSVEFSVLVTTDSVTSVYWIAKSTSDAPTPNEFLNVSPNEVYEKGVIIVPETGTYTGNTTSIPAETTVYLFMYPAGGSSEDVVSDSDTTLAAEGNDSYKQLKIPKTSWVVNGKSSEDAAHVAENVFDDSTETYWLTTDPRSVDPVHWITIDLGEAYNVIGVDISNRTDSATGGLYSVDVFVVSDIGAFSPNSALVTAKIRGATGDSGISSQVRFAAIEGRYIVLRCLDSRGDGAPWAVSEVDVWQLISDVTAPVLTFPTASPQTSRPDTTGTFSVTTDTTNGFTRCVLTTSATPPTNEQVWALTDENDAAPVASRTSVSVTSTSIQFNFTGLTKSTTYYVYAVHKDSANNLSLVATASFTTSAVQSQIYEIDAKYSNASWNLAGVPGGIPTRLTMFANVKNPPYNAVGDGDTDDTTAITTAIADCPANQYVYIPTGTYKLTSRIYFPSGRSNITIRGDGMDKTRLNFSGPNYGFYFGSKTFGPIMGITSTTQELVAGTSTIKVATTVGKSIAVGRMMMINQLNDGTLVDPTNYTGSPVTFSDRDKNGTRCLQQMVRVTSFTSTTISFEPPLYYGLTSTLNPEACVLTGTIEGTGVEEMELVSVNGTMSYYATWFLNAQKCWVKNVKTNNIKGWHQFWHFGLQNEVRGCEIYNAGPGAGAGNGYGLEARNQSAMLIEDNIIREVQWPLLLNCGSNGCVVGYNFLWGNWNRSDDLFLNPIIQANHGAHPMLNLYEGNIAGKFHANNYHGSCSHMVVFRNRLRGFEQRPNYGPTIRNRMTVSLDARTSDHAVIGNILGDPISDPPITWDYYSREASASHVLDYKQSTIFRFGYKDMANNGISGYDANTLASTIIHGNYDYKNNSITNITGEKTILPNSLYLVGKPTWFGALTWPPVDPSDPKTYNAGIIPAGARFLALTTPSPT